MPQFLKVSWFLRMSPSLLEDGFEFGLHVGQLRQQAGLDHFIDVGAGERQRREEAALNLREVLLLRLAHVAQHGVHVFLGRDDDPGPATADRPQLLRDGLQVEHQVGVGADELADFIDQEHDPVLRPLGIQVLLDPLAEVLDRHGEVVFGPVDPLFGCGLALAERFAERLDDLIPVELVGVPLLDPIEAGVLFVGGVERLQLALGFEVTLHVGDVRVIAAVALQLVQDLEEDPQDQVTPRAAAVVGLAVDVEEDDIGVGDDRPLDVPKEHGVLDLALEELDRLLALAVVRVRAVVEQVRQHLQEVRLAGAEEARNPDAHLAGRVGVLPLVHGFEIPGDELAEVLVEFPGDDELIQLLPDGGIVKLVGLHDAVDGPEDVTFKEVLDEHVSLDLRNQLEGPVVVVVLELAEQPERLPVVSAWVKHHERRLAHDRLKVVQQGMGPQQRPHAADAGHDHEIVLLRLGDLGEEAAEFGFVQRASEGLLQRLVALSPAASGSPCRAACGS